MHRMRNTSRPRKRGNRITEATRGAIARIIDASKTLEDSLMDGDAVISLRITQGIARRVIKSARRKADVDSYSSGLTISELEFLQHSGFSLEEPPLEDDPILLGEAEYSELLKNSLSTADAARGLNVDESRIRQRLGNEHSLLGIRVGKGWRVPLYQFRRIRKGLLELHRGLERVIPSIDPEHHPVTIYRWLHTPNPDLEDANGKALSPLNWLRTGGSPVPVAGLAKDL